MLSGVMVLESNCSGEVPLMVTPWFNVLFSAVTLVESAIWSCSK